MLIQDAIKILIDYDIDLDASNDEENQTAVRLGVQALIRIDRQRHNETPFYDFSPLPGETLA